MSPAQRSAQVEALLWSARAALTGAEKIDPARRKFAILENDMSSNAQKVSDYLTALAKREKALEAELATAKTALAAAESHAATLAADAAIIDALAAQLPSAPAPSPVTPAK